MIFPPKATIDLTPINALEINFNRHEMLSCLAYYNTCACSCCCDTRFDKTDQRQLKRRYKHSKRQTLPYAVSILVQIQ